MKKLALNISISLLIGGTFLWFATKDWSWDSIVDSIRPLDGHHATVHLVLEHPDPLTLQFQLVRNGAFASLPLVVTDARNTPESPHHPPPSLAGLPGVPLEGPIPRQLLGANGEADGQWEVRLVDAGSPSKAGPAPPPIIHGFAMDFRPQVERHQRPDPFDPMLLMAPTTKGDFGHANAHRIDVRDMHLRWLVPYVCLMLLAHLLRIYRWGLLLKPLGFISPGRLLAVSSVGLMAIALLPFRLGEFVRPYLASDKTDISMTSALATCVVERVADGLFVSLFLSMVLIAVKQADAPPFLVSAGYAAAAVFLSLLFLLIFIHWRRHHAVALLQRWAGYLHKGLGQRLAMVLDTFLRGLSVLPNVKSLALFLTITLIYWILNGLGFYLLFFCCGLTVPGGGAPSFLAALTIMSVLAIGIIAPAGPGFIGNYQFFLDRGLGLFLDPGVVATRGAVYILLMHVMQLAFLCAVGFPFLLTGSISLRRAVAQSKLATGSL